MRGGVATARRKRAAIELVAREGAELRRFARRYSLCEDDAEDACQRALEILLVKAPDERPRELSSWMRTVIKREAMALRAYRERMLGVDEAVGEDPVDQVAGGGAGPGERTEQRELLARSREALRSLTAAELHSLTLCAAGYSYAEISEMTGLSQAKVSRNLTTGRERFHRHLSRSEDGSRCAELLPLLSAYCDGEASPDARMVVREHLRACASCRATMRTFRATPAAVAALAPALPASRSLLERAQELLLGLHSRLAGIGGTSEGGVAQVAAAGGGRGAGAAALAKALAICAGTVGGATACVATGVVPAPLGLGPQPDERPRTERVAERVVEDAPPTVDYEPAPPSPGPRAKSEPTPEPEPEPEVPAGTETTEAVEAGAVEYAPPAASPAPQTPESPSASSGNPAGEFGP